MKKPGTTEKRERSINPVGQLGGGVDPTWTGEEVWPIAATLARGITWSDRLFQMQATDGGTRTYVLERNGCIMGFVTIHEFRPSGLSIDEIVVDPSKQGHGYGGILLRFADTLARHADCRSVRLNAIANRVEWYRAHGYDVSPGTSLLLLDDENYQPMERPVLYDVPPAQRPPG